MTPMNKPSAPPIDAALPPAAPTHLRTAEPAGRHRRQPAAEAITIALIGPEDLDAALSGIFDPARDRLLTATSGGAAAVFSRQLRFDDEHWQGAPPPVLE